ncbi:dihydroorotate dehydrogenase B (NAD(+)), electron transfer subunit [Deferribacterales bacterium]|nr:dihydroorotate dehydrogenase B (NAD(+)), electron transfer subunit [Deferribacterales bacterium]
MQATIIENTSHNSYGFLSLSVPEEAVNDYRPGQFYMLSANNKNTYDPILRRPFAPYSVNSDRHELTFLFSIVGRGTRALADMGKDVRLSISAPLGNPFKILKGNIALIAGGVGLAPINYLAKQLIYAGANVTLYYGARNKDLLFPPFIDNKFGSFKHATPKSKQTKLVICTDDGSYEIQGFGTDLFATDVANTHFDACYAVGPKPMMRAAHDICVKHNIPLHISLEEIMACGVGACGGCMIDIKRDGKIQSVRCCTEGPAFDSKEVFF